MSEQEIDVGVLMNFTRNKWNDINEELDREGKRFNAFSISGVGHYEKRHSKIIAELLNPHGRHGFKSQFIRSFVKILKLDIQDFDRVSVRLEHCFDGGQIDILINCSGKAIIIENKIYAKDQKEQLKKYQKYANDEYGSGYDILYLTLDGKSASDSSGEGVDYFRISYQEHIISWLVQCAKMSSCNPVVNEGINQYITHLKELIGQGVNIDIEGKVIQFLSENIYMLYSAQLIYSIYKEPYRDVCEQKLKKIIGSSSDEHQVDGLLGDMYLVDYAKVIHDSYMNFFSCMSRDFFNEKMRVFASDNELDYHFHGADCRHIKFFLRFKEGYLSDKVRIDFSFESKKCIFGLYYFNNYRIDVKSFIKHLNKNTDFKFKRGGDWMCYGFFEELSIEKWKSDIIDSESFLQECKTKINILLKSIEYLSL